LFEEGKADNKKKSKFCYTQAKYLGYIVGGGFIKTDQSKVQAIREFSQSISDWQMRRFLRITGWYRCCIQNYQTASPLHVSLKKDLAL